MTSADQFFGTERRRGDGRRGPAHAKTSPRWPDDSAGPYAAQATFAMDPPQAVGDPRFGRLDPRWPDAGPPAYQNYQDYYQADHYQPEYPGRTRQPAPQPDYPGWTGQSAPQADYQGWTQQPPPQADYPDWTGTPANQDQYTDPGWPRQSAPQPDYPGWTGQPAPQADYQGWTQQPPPQADYPDWTGTPQPEYARATRTVRPVCSPSRPSQLARIPVCALARRGPGDRPPAVAVAPPLPERVRPPFTPQPDFPPRADVPPNVLAPRRDIPLHRDMDFYSAPIMPDTITDVANWAQPDVAYAQPAREQIWDAGSSQLADWIIEDANQRAAEITREARNQASNSLADAQKEAAELVRRTGEQAALTIEAAELQAAEIRATMMKLTTDLTGMASYVTQRLTAAPPTSAQFLHGDHLRPGYRRT